MANFSFYLFRTKYPKWKNYTKGFKKLLVELDIKAELKLSCTRYEYDDSDNTSWVLLYGKKTSQIQIDRGKLMDIECDGQKVFNVSGNGYGTGLSIMLNYNKRFK